MSSFPAHTGIEFVLPLRTKSVKDAAIEGEVLGLFDLLQSRLLRFAISFGLSTQDGEDVVQETFLALVRHLQRDRNQENLPAWLFRVAHNLALKRRLRSKMELPVGGYDALAERGDPSLNPEQWLLEGERHANLQAALHALPLGDQSCLRLRAAGLRYREIAEVLGISLGSVAASLSRSFERLQQADQR